MNIKSVKPEDLSLNSESERIIRNLYAAAEEQNADKFASLFTEDGTFNDESGGRIYKGKEELAMTVKIYAIAFPDMHRELYDMYVCGDVVIVELSLNGTHKGPLMLPSGTIPATGKTIKTPCCDVFRIKDGKVFSFNCYAIATTLFAQLGVLGNLGAAFESSGK